MAIHTALCDFLGTKHPIMLAGMGGVSYAELAAAMCNAGGYGVLGMAGTSPDTLRQVVEATLTKLPKVQGGSGLSLAQATAKIFANAEKAAKKAGDVGVTLERLLLATALGAARSAAPTSSAPPIRAQAS